MDFEQAVAAMQGKPSIEELQKQLFQMLWEKGITDAGFFQLPEEEGGALRYGVSLVFHLSDAVTEEIQGRPTHSYFHHYRTANFFLDQAMLQVGILLERSGYRYLPVGASQSIPTEQDPHGFHGRFPHKKGACLAGLGVMGMNGLFLHRRYGPRVRLGTVFTDCPLTEANHPYPLEDHFCLSCRRCVEACPAQAIRGEIYQPGMPDFSLIDPMKCSNYMKAAYQKIGRGAVCGICMQVCPRGKQNQQVVR